MSARTIEAKARELGVWRALLDGPMDGGNIRASRSRGGYEVWHRIRINGRVSEPVSAYITEPVALAWLAALETGETLDVGPCQSCATRGGGWQWAQRGFGSYAEWQPFGHVHIDGHDPDTHRRPGFQGGWTCSGAVDSDGANELLVAKRPCPECSEPGTMVACPGCRGRRETLNPLLGTWEYCESCGGRGHVPGPRQPTGRDTRTLAQAVLDARDPEATHVRDAVAVWADKRQSKGEDVGALVMKALRLDLLEHPRQAASA